MWFGSGEETTGERSVVPAVVRCQCRSPFGLKIVQTKVVGPVSFLVALFTGMECGCSEVKV